MQMSGQACTLLGQALGGVLYVAWGAAALFLFDAATFAYAGVSTSFIRSDRRERLRQGSLSGVVRQYAEEMRDGLAYVRHHGMIPLLVTFACVNLLFMPVFVLLPLYMRDVLGRGPSVRISLAAAGEHWRDPPRALSCGRGLEGFGTGPPMCRGVAVAVLCLSAARQPWVPLAAFAAVECCRRSSTSQ
jgi:hypothetical protein